MRLADVLDTSVVKAVRVVPGVSLAEAAQAMHREDATAILVESEQFQGVLTAGSILRLLTSSGFADIVWNHPVTMALGKEQDAPVDQEAAVVQTIQRMMAVGRDHLPVATKSGIVVVSLCRLLLAENNTLHGEIQHLQTYIDALHDAPND